MSYDAALQAFADDGIPLDQRMIILSSYCEFTGKLPESTDLRQSEPHDRGAGHRHGGQTAAGQERVTLAGEVYS